MPDHTHVPQLQALRVRLENIASRLLTSDALALQPVLIVSLYLLAFQRFSLSAVGLLNGLRPAASSADPTWLYYLPLVHHVSPI